MGQSDEKLEDENNDSSLFLQRAFQFTFLLGLAKTESILNENLVIINLKMLLYNN